MLALLCAALLGQSLLVQSHVHAPASQQGAAASLVQASDVDLEGGSKSEPGKAVHDCFLCREVAAGGHYLLSPPAAILLVIAATGWLARTTLQNWPLPPPAIGWHGRAPPR